MKMNNPVKHVPVDTFSALKALTGAGTPAAHTTPQPPPNVAYGSAQYKLWAAQHGIDTSSLSHPGRLINKKNAKKVLHGARVASNPLGSAVGAIVGTLTAPPTGPELVSEHGGGQGADLNRPKPKPRAKKPPTRVDTVVPKKTNKKQVAAERDPASAGGGGGGGGGTTSTPAYSPPVQAPIDYGSFNIADYMDAAKKIAQALMAGPLGMIDQQTKLGTGALNDFSSGYQKTLSGVPEAIGQNYDQAINAQAAISDAIKASLSGQNPAGQNQSILDAINQPSSSTGNSIYDAGGAVLGGEGGLAASGLEANKAADQAFANMMPSIAKAQSQIALSRFLNSQSGQRSSVSSQLPQLAYNIAQGMVSNQAELAKLKTADRAFGLDVFKANNTAAHDVALENQAAANAAETKRYHDALIEARKTATYKSADTQQRLIIDKLVTAAKPVTQSGYWQKDGSIVNDPDANTLRDATGKPINVHHTVAGISYGQFVARAKAQGVKNPYDVAWSIYGRGENGRPALKPEERTALKEAFPRSPGLQRAGKLGGVFFLTGKQLRALKNKGLYPPVNEIKDERGGTVFVLNGV